jgi:putative AdoMet-dependent methyltransferase
MNVPWLYDETVQTGTDFRDEAEVRAYDERMAKLRDVAKEAEEIGAAVAITPGSVIWEIGTGTGEGALSLARSCRQVIAIDVSPAMLAYARRKAAERKIANARFEPGGFLAGFAPEGPVDAVVSQLALHHLPDFWKARGLLRIASKLRPGGRLFLRDVVYPAAAAESDGWFQQSVDAVREKGGDSAAQRTIDHIQKEYSTFDWVLEGMLQRAGFTVLKKNAEGFLTSYLCGK